MMTAQPAQEKRWRQAPDGGVDRAAPFFDVIQIVVLFLGALPALSVRTAVTHPHDRRR